MKILKVTDVVIQVSMLVFFPVKAIIDNDASLDTMIAAYFWIGGYQVASCLVQFIARFNQRGPNNLRMLYQKMLFALIVAGIICLPFYFFFLVALLIVSPILALFYTGLSIRETVKIIGYEK